ncbi:MAG: hypothetical protein V7K41_00025 [Nostoc sp.]|uniref:hypothetical protein n=1 Tax=Nostoc sp. TaxID=1180 RepID=UPI002FFB5EB2
MGETSDGLHLLATAQNYAQRIKDPRYVDKVLNGSNSPRDAAYAVFAKSDRTCSYSHLPI